MTNFQNPNTSQKWSPGKISKLGTWNVRGLRAAGKVDIVLQEIQRYKITIIGLSETHWRNSGHFCHNDFWIYHYLCENASINGVAIVIPNLLNHLITSYKAVNDRIITLRLNTKPLAINITQVYLPTCDHTDEEVEAVYQQLESTLSITPTREISIILGDFNAKIGNTITDDHARSAVGKFGMG